jgi:hypothetical protein
MNKCAFVIPLHPKHFIYTETIIQELSGSDADLWFVFTNNEDRDLFQSKSPVNSLVLSDYTDLTIVEKTNSFITLKKFYALLRLKDKYEYIACIDSEVKFIKNRGFYELMKQISQSKRFYGSALAQENFGRCILYEALFNVTPESDHEHLLNLSRVYSVFTWWSNIPVYTCAYLDEFFRWIDFDKNLEKYSWSVFDHMVYNYFCVLFKEYRIKLDPDITTSFEFLESSVVEKLDTHLVNWVNYKAYNTNPEYYNNNEFYIVFHCDRQ